jgi:hypothetical protein
MALASPLLIQPDHWPHNMCREHASTITNAQTVTSFPATGTSQRPSRP